MLVPDWYEVGSRPIESLYVEVERENRKSDVMMGVFCGPPNHEEEVDEAVCKKEISRLQNLMVMGDFCLDSNSTVPKQYRKFLDDL